jgi:hypothetical protein
VTLKAFFTFSLIAALLVGLGFAVLAYQAVPRESCDWEADFCSEYGAFYAAIALIMGSAAGLFGYALWRSGR